MKISQKRQKELAVDMDTVRVIYEEACTRWGRESVILDLNWAWNMRCIMGMEGMIPFKTGLVSQNLSEFTYVLKHLVLGKS